MSKITREPSKFTRVVNPNNPTITRSKQIEEVSIKRTNAKPRTITRPQNITSFTPLPSDVMTEFLNNMTCLDLQELKTKNTAFSKYITSDMIAKSVNLNYPRSTGKANVYKIPIEPNLPQLKFIEQIRNIKKYYYTKNRTGEDRHPIIEKEIKLAVEDFDNNFPKYKDKLKSLISYHPNYYVLSDLTNNIIENLIVDLFNDYIIKAPKNITRGDIIVTNFNRIVGDITDREYPLEIKLIYDGRCKFVKLDRFRLPLEFKVLEDNVPIDYWIGNGGLSIYQDGGDFDRQYVNIDLGKYKDEILRNLVFEQYNNTFGDFTRATSTLVGNKLLFDLQSYSVERNNKEYLYQFVENLGITTFLYNHIENIFKWSR